MSTALTTTHERPASPVGASATTPAASGVPAPGAGPDAAGARHDRDVLPVMTALVVSMFVSMLATTVVSSSLPVIVADLGGSQSAFTWVVTATLLATTVSTPIWGKVADLVNRKALLLVVLGIFVVATCLAGLSRSVEVLIAMRVLQGLGGGGLAALSQIVMADVVSPRERGRYAGLFGASMAVGTVGGPLLGGFLTDAFSWRWNFYVALPFAALAIVLIVRNLHLPQRVRSSARVDYLGIVLLSTGISLLLLWVTFADSSFAWVSWQSAAMLGGSLALLGLAVWWELRAEDPLLPLSLFRGRTFTLAVVASLSTGIAMFGASVFLAQYMQLARGATPMMSGVLTIPMMAGLLLASTIVGQLVSRRGAWKGYVVTGSVLMIVGNVMLSRLHYDTTYWYVALGMGVLGAGVGMVMQNLVIVTQNEVPISQLGVATSAVTFFRSLGGTVGVSVMGSVLGGVVASQLQQSVAALPPDARAQAAEVLGSGTLPKIADLPVALRELVESAYGLGVGRVFVAALPMAVVTLLAVLALPNQRLGTQSGIERHRAEGGAVVGEPSPDAVETVAEEVEDTAIEVAAAVAALPPVGSTRPGDGPDPRGRAGE
ncbi:EmrB/QacA subfamily drug resistance transporter [Salana multivorans]|uniref:EmrB/QacA subfamily drug resistance transporter n=2 Tax=Salana multivorans TaxID=120377 RepID=A0A3N2D9Q3_9MICO|nr:MDR family MFS transporter [Salana multivorans]ROR96526.1 EmrB/QacA subfamily drug resistance transporter [Salana multivorans]